MILDDGCPEKWTKSIFIDTFINHALSVTQIYHLEAQTEITIRKLNEILTLLPDVKSLKISSLPLTQVENITEEEIQFLSFLSSKSQFKKIYLESVTKMEELYMMLFICTSINYLQINCVDYMHVELLTELILTQTKDTTNHSLRLLCFCVRQGKDDGDMVEKLERFIIEKNLIFDFMIKYQQEKIYLQWK